MKSMFNIFKIITIHNFLFIYYNIYDSFSQYNFITQKFKMFISNKTIFSKILIWSHKIKTKKKLQQKYINGTGNRKQLTIK